MKNEIEERFVALQEFVVAARDKLADHPWGYVVGGTETETAQRRNRSALDSLALRPRVLADVSNVDSTTTLLGRHSRLPVFLCPIGGLESFDPDGAITVARAASQFGVPMMLSSVSKWPVEKVAESVPASEPGKSDLSLIFQLYARTDASGVDALVDRSLALDLPAFCITVDSAVYSRRERDIVSRFVKPWRADGEGTAAHYQAALNWKDISRIRKRWNGPLILKGIATAEDALIAIDHGVDVIYVSNHGGRQLDHVLGSTAVLPEVTEAVNGRAVVFVDGGYCRGTDIAKAIALGASGVGLGRMMCLALAAAGAPGVVRMLELLETEFQIVLGLLGVDRVSDIRPSHVQSCDPMPFDHALSSAFPLLADFKY
ncbi:MAG: alpha-hydroxy acid oxidase [Burkholderiaceae bacterium]